MVRSGAKFYFMALKVDLLMLADTASKMMINHVGKFKFVTMATKNNRNYAKISGHTEKRISQKILTPET